MSPLPPISGRDQKFAISHFSPWLPGLMLIICLSGTAQFWQYARQDAEIKLRTSFDYRVQNIVGNINQRLKIYEQMLQGIQGLYNSSVSVSREEFRSYIDAIHLHENTPGIQSVQFVKWVPAAQKAQYIDAIRKAGIPEFTIQPGGERESYCPVTFVEQFSAPNQTYLGFDTCVDEANSVAQNQARDTGMATITGRTTVSMESSSTPQAGVTMVLPVYNNSMPHNSVADRRVSIEGWIAARIYMTDLIAETIVNTPGNLDVEIYDGVGMSDKTLLYDTDHIRSFSRQAGLHFNATQPILVANRTWTIVIYPLPDFLGQLDKEKSRSIAYFGIGVSLFLACLVWLLLKWRELALKTAIKINKSLIESEERWKFAIEGSGDGVWDWNIQTNEAKFSKRWKEMLGYAEDDIMPTFQEWAQRIHPDEQPYVAATLQKYLEGKTASYSVEFRMRCKDESYKWIVARGMVVSRNEEGKPLRMIGMHTDTTERKQLEQSTEEALNRLQKIASRVPGVVYQFLLCPDGSSCFPFASEAIREIYRVNPEDVREDSSKVFAILHPEDLDTITASIQESAKNLTVWSHEYRVKFDDGSVRWLLGNAIPQREADGAVLWHGFITDITERKQIENKLLSSEASLKEAQRLSNIGSWELDLINNRLVWSDEVFRIFEMDPSEGGSYEAFMQAIHPQDRTLVDTAYLESVKNKSDYNIVHRLLMPDGRIKYVHERAETFYNQNQAIRSIGTVQDITLAKLVEDELRLYREQLEFLVKKRTTELEAVNQELEAFAYSVSHDLRAPLRGIDGFSQALLEDYAPNLDDTGRNYLDRIRAASQRMGLLIDEMLKLSRITRATIKYNQVDLSSLAAVVLQQLQESMPEHRVETSIKAGILCWGDSGLLKIALENLLGNAWKYSAKQPNPRIEFGNLMDNEEIVYYISDNGVGFDMQYADKLFGAFQRLHHRDQFEGIGIGLATVKRIIHRHGGRIWATSEPNTKTTFFFTLANEALS